MYTWAEINIDNLEHNFKSLRKLLDSQVKLMQVVKQNAYGHGLIEIAKAAERFGVDFFGVHSKDEALNLIENQISLPILILSNVIEDNNSHYLIKNKVRFSIRDEFLLAMLDAEAKKLGTKAYVHIKVDTGMNRLGINDEVAVDFIINALEKYENIYIEGIFSHFSSADSDQEYTLFQLQKFEKIIHEIEARGIDIPIKHIANSSAIFSYQSSQLNMVRSGIALYGICPVAGKDNDLKPVLSLKSRIIHIKGIPSESFVSYSKTYKTERNTTLAIVDLGYGHGLPWNLSNNFQVIIKGKRRNVVGRVCMDHILVDVTEDGDVDVGDIVTVIGTDGDETITVYEIAKRANTIPYEILTRLQHLPKEYI